MSTKNLAIVGLRLLAIYCFVQAVPLFTTFVSMTAISQPDAFRTSPSATLVFSLLPGGSLWLLAVLLYVFSAPLARRFAPDESTESKEMVCTFEQLQALAFAVAGVLILVTALPALGTAVEGLVSLYRERREGGTIPLRGYRGNWLYCIGVIAQFAAGLVLVLNPRGIRNAWHWLRTAGTGPAPLSKETP